MAVAGGFWLDWMPRRWGLGDWRHGCGDGHGALKASFRRLIGRLLDGEERSAFPCHPLVSVCVRRPICLSAPVSRTSPVNQSVSELVSQLFSHLSGEAQAHAHAQALAQTAWVACGPRAPPALTPSLPRSPALNFVDGAWHVCMPTGSFCRPTDDGLCVGLTRGRGFCDVNASAIMVKIHPSWHFLIPNSPGSRDCRCCHSGSCATSSRRTFPSPAAIENTMYPIPIPSAASPTAPSVVCTQQSKRNQSQTHDRSCPWSPIAYAVENVSRRQFELRQTDIPAPRPGRPGSLDI